jgi:hypothetical protein
VSCVVRGKKDSERDKNRKISGDEEKKKIDKSGKKRGCKKKSKFVFAMVLGRIDPWPQPRRL